MNGPLKEVSVLAPQYLTSTGRGLLGFNIRFEGLDTDRFAAVCSVSGPDGTPGTRMQAEVSDSGLVNLILPGQLYGATCIDIDLFDRAEGWQLKGAFTLAVQSLSAGSSIVVNAGAQPVSGNAVSYQPIEVRGVETRPVETVGDHRRIHVPLLVKRLKDAVPVGDVLETENTVVLSEEEPVRVFDLHIGPRLTVGRCLQRDIRKDPAAWERLRRACRGRRPAVDWVVAWDDGRFNRLLLSLGFGGGDEGYSLEVENLTGYSRVASPIEVTVEDQRQLTVPAGERDVIDVAAGRQVVFRALRGTERHEFLRCLVAEIQVGEDVVPVVRTFKSRFCWPPADVAPEEGQLVRFMGLWIPQTQRNLAKLLRPSRKRLWVSFPEEDGAGFQIDWDDRLCGLAVASTVNLRACLKGE